MTVDGDNVDLNEESNLERREDKDKSASTGWTGILILAGVATTFGASLPVGYNIGVVNTPAEIIKQFCNESFHSRYDVTLTESSLSILWSSIVSIFIIGGVTGSCLGALVADNFGRKGGIILTNGVALLASVFFISSFPSNSVEMLLIGRLLVGLSGGLATSIIPMYLIELAPIKVRGSMGVLCPLGVTFGVLVGQIMSLNMILGKPGEWHYLLALYGILIILFTPFIVLLPESPKYLLAVKKDYDAAIKSLCRTRQKPAYEISSDISDLRGEVGENNSDDKWGLLQVVRSAELRLALLLVCLMQAGQQTSGINAVFYYSNSIFIKANLSESAAELATIGAGVVNCVMAILAIPLMARCGRRPLAIVSTASATVCLVCLCITIRLIDSVTWMPKLCIAAVLLYVLFYGLGLGPIPYFIASELFEVGPRPAAMALGSLCNWAGNFLVGMTFPLLQSSIGPYSFLLFATSTGCLCLFIKFFLPETKGKSPVEVALQFRGGFRVARA
ncbi:solute carrier family 2, facilitated glucose transporter member 3-like isoform X2 [Arctopsyche grandis]|uniref:solute carrier family 2, facilitated glucose transporter member 3-like isoform X2 n=1 Tax=Arctopsyche grandis TaxID=121162 RepID=UPI00406D6903